MLIAVFGAIVAVVTCSHEVPADASCWLSRSTPHSSTEVSRIGEGTAVSFAVEQVGDTAATAPVVGVLCDILAVVICVQKVPAGDRTVSL